VDYIIIEVYDTLQMSVSDVWYFSVVAVAVSRLIQPTVGW